MGGLIAAGLASIFGIGALASVLGFVLQVALVAGAAYLVVAFIRSRNQPAPAYARGPSAQGPGERLQAQSYASNGSAAKSVPALPIDQTDLDTFEKLLVISRQPTAGRTLNSSARRRRRRCSPTSVRICPTTPRKACAMRSHM